jgi:hypothetical protein
MTTVKGAEREDDDPVYAVVVQKMSISTGHGDVGQFLTEYL